MRKRGRRKRKRKRKRYRKGRWVTIANHQGISDLAPAANARIPVRSGVFDDVFPHLECCAGVFRPA